MKNYSKETKRFLLAAKTAEFNALQQLSGNCNLVTVVCEMIHQIQRERAVSNVFLASKGIHFPQRRESQIAASQHAENALFEILSTEHSYLKNAQDSSRLLYCITLAMQGMDGLYELRQRVAKQTLSVSEATQAFSRLIASFLSMVFEAADVASHPSITKSLVALFNFIQGKEYAGQERATGVIGFAEGAFNTNLCQRLVALKSAQEASFGVFDEFSEHADHKSMWALLENNDVCKQLSQLRNMIASLADGAPIARDISEVWYEVTTNRIDKMHDIENQMTSNLLMRANALVEKCQQELDDDKKRIASLSDMPVSEGSPYTLLFDPTMPGLLTSQELSKTLLDETSQSTAPQKPLYDMIKGQSNKIKLMAAELDAAKQSIRDQKVISRAKYLLMEHSQLSEKEAYRELQKAAMDQSLKLIDIAKKLVTKVDSDK